MRYRIVNKSNFDDEMFNESWFCTHSYSNETDAIRVASAHNDRKNADTDPSYAVVVTADYVLYEFQP